MLPLADWRAHTHGVADHRRIPIALFGGALTLPAMRFGRPGTRPAGRFVKRDFGVVARAAAGCVSLWKNEGKNRS
jgi:hypothetical protein